MVPGFGYPQRVIVYLNGQLVPGEEARVSVFDRGFIFGDGVYEGLRVVPNGKGGGRVVGLAGHTRRLREGLAKAQIAWDAAQIGDIAVCLAEASGLKDAFVYVQITRGTPVWGGGEPVRSRVPVKGSAMQPTVFACATPQPSLEAQERSGPAEKSAVTVEDIRWAWGRLKSVSLMGNVLSALAAAEEGADDGVFVRTIVDEARGTVERRVVEGLATNVVLVLPEKSGKVEIVTPSLESGPMLEGITREILLADGGGGGAEPRIVERMVREEELARATEVMLLGTISMVTSVTRLNGRTIGDGRAGPVARALLKKLIAAIRGGA